MLQSILTKLNDEGLTTSYTCKYLILQLPFDNAPGKEICYPMKI